MPPLILCWRKRWGMRLVEANHWLISSRLDQPLWHLRNTYISYIVNVYNYISVNLLEFHQSWLSGFLDNFYKNIKYLEKNTQSNLFLGKQSLPCPLLLRQRPQLLRKVVWFIQPLAHPNLFQGRKGGGEI